jgi:hypothetical protein
MKDMRRLSIIAWIGAGLLTACGSSKTLTSLSSTGGATGTGTTGTVTILSLGSGSGSTFKSGVIGISTPSLSAGGSTSLQVSLVDQNGALYTTSTAITFSSPCAGQGLASITVAGAPAGTATLTTTTGTASATYAATGCSGSDSITATASANGQTLIRFRHAREHHAQGRRQRRRLGDLHRHLQSARHLRGTARRRQRDLHAQYLGGRHHHLADLGDDRRERPGANDRQRRHGGDVGTRDRLDGELFRHHHLDRIECLDGVDRHPDQQ